MFYKIVKVVSYVIFSCLILKIYSACLFSQNYKFNNHLNVACANGAILIVAAVKLFVLTRDK